MERHRSEGSLAAQRDAGQPNKVIPDLCVNSRYTMPGGGLMRISADSLELDGSET